MGIDMEMDFDKRSSVGLSPNTVLLPPRHCSSIEKRNINRKPTRRDDVLRVKEGFRESSFHSYRSSSCKSIPSSPAVVGGSDELKRGSIYQSSQEVRKMKKMGAIEGRKNIELSRSSESSLSFRVVDSLCSSDEESSKRTSLMSEKSNSNAMSLCESSVELPPSDGFIEFCLNSDKRGTQSAETARRNRVEDLKLRCDEVVVPLNDGNVLLERDAILTFQKSHSAKVEMPSSPSLSESGHSSKASSKARFSPIRRMFDPFKKSKSLRSPLGYTLQPNEVRITTGMETAREGTIRKSLLDDFSYTAHKSEFDSHLVKKDQYLSPVANSPVHLHGFLKFENKQGIPSFEFSLNSPEDIIVAKTWKADNAFNWVYTFHSPDGRKRSNATSWGATDGNKGPMVGQMQVSSNVCRQVKDGGVSDNTMVNEFVLYDTACARQSPKGSNPGSVEGNDESNDRSNSSNKLSLCPWASGDLSPNLEVAAIVIEVPFEKRESLKCKRGHKTSYKMHSNLLNLSMVEQQKDHHLDSRISEKVKVVIPTGNHGFPSDDNRGGPTSLLNRWRLGGGCDCGGWDMACPLTVFGSPTIRNTADQPLLDRHQPLEIFVQGAKERIPALTMVALDEGWYAVDFHAQLSTLQAFSICVAILHGTEAAAATGGLDRSMQLPYSNSLKVLQEEVKCLIEAVTEEEKKKVTKKREEITPPTYMINPPFSPIARV